MTLHLVTHESYGGALGSTGSLMPGKHARVAELVRAAAPALAAHEPEPLDPRWAMAAHDPDYVAAVLSARLDARRERRIGFAVTPRVAERSLRAAGGTLLAAQLALEHGYAANGAGGSHHAGPDGGAGYCVLNDLAITALRLLDERRVRRLAIVDLDVHQGDGTARILTGRPEAFTLSVHAERNFPVRKANSDLDIGLPDGTGDEAYLAALEPALAEMIERARPELILYQAGVDPHRDDRLGRLALSDAGLLARDRMVMHCARAHGVPVASVLGGGYGEVDAVARRHARTVLALHEATEGHDALAA